jgi:hypothetical protein
MTTKTVYQTDRIGILIGTALADPCPLQEGEWLIPGGCVEDVPPIAGKHQVPRWTGKRWELISSYQGLTVYNTRTCEALVIERSGDLPSGYTLSVPAPGQVWRQGEWVDDIPATLARVHQEQTERINVQCEKALVGGFGSNALGAMHRYGSQTDDQLNLIGVILAGRDTLYACRDEAGAKDYRPHTVEQIRQVGDDLTAFRQVQLQKANALKQALDQALAAEDLAALQTVAWDART